ncbi:MAG: DUF512 domain-containing protein [Acetobacteraceae bacterium]|nr:DUF512 domain-containing protein [Acetobacteraceae bacterium]
MAGGRVGGRMGGRIRWVVPGSPAGRAGVRRGECVLSVNGFPVTDLIDYRYLTAEPRAELEICDAGGAVRRVRLRREPGEDLGLDFDRPVFGPIRRCSNRCLFCFVDQLPPGLRDSLYVKDDDYRLSFLNSTFITLTNLRPADWSRLERLRLSPLYVSVHTTSPSLRARLLGNPRAARLFEHLARLDRAGIDLHLQVVLCPGLNDGRELDRTLDDLGRIGPRLLSVAVVPVGLTRHRSGLYPLKPFDARAAEAAIHQVERWARIWRRRGVRGRVWASDELYCLAGLAVPPARHYGLYPQVENGVGLVRRFLDGWSAYRRCAGPVAGAVPPAAGRSRRVAVVTAPLAAPVLAPVVEALGAASRPAGTELELVGVENRLLGETVTVAGLLCGSDLERALAGRRDLCEVLLPAVALDGAASRPSGRGGGRAAGAALGRARFLDGMKLQDLQRRLGVPVRAVEPTAAALAEALVGPGREGR